MLNLKMYLLLAFMLLGSVACGKLKLLAFTRPHHGFVGLKWRTPKLLGLKHGLGHGLGLFGGHGSHGHGGGGFHNSGYEHHEYHSSHHSSGGGGLLGWLGK